ncbi:Protein of unknown function [Cotesia congregata]|uniref:Uncharacterized protein n=1 Tax=Cotesia congregata TaxID=51543 RepID=A0A8J2HC75_COTCN|nr:Protein of unknown function [Cotesia congregata]
MDRKSVKESGEVSGWIGKSQRETQAEFKEGGSEKGGEAKGGAEKKSLEKENVEEKTEEKENERKKDTEGNEEVEEEEVSEASKGRGRRTTAEAWKLHRANSTGDLGDIRDWVKGDGKRRGGGLSDLRENKVRLIAKTGDKKREGMEAMR